MTAPPGWDGLLDPDEKILWQGHPDRHFRLRKRNIALSVFGLFFLGSSFFMIIMAPGMSGPANMPLFILLFELPFLAAGLYMVFGVHFFDTWKRAHTVYTLTNKHAFIATDTTGKKLKSYPIDAQTPITFKPGPPDSVFFATELRARNRTSSTVPVGFELISDGQKVYKLIREVQAGTA